MPKANLSQLAESGERRGVVLTPPHLFQSLRQIIPFQMEGFHPIGNPAIDGSAFYVFASENRKSLPIVHIKKMLVDWRV